MHGHGTLHLQASNQSPITVQSRILSLVVAVVAAVAEDVIDAVAVAATYWELKCFSIPHQCRIRH